MSGLSDLHRATPTAPDGAHVASVPATDPRAQGKRPVTRHQWVDLAVLAALILIAMVGFQPPYGGWFFLVGVVGGLVVGGGAALLGYWLRLNVLNTYLLGVVGYFLFGTALTLPGRGLFAVLPSLDSLWALASGAVFSWRDILTLQTPIGGPDHMAVLPYLATILGAMLAWLLALRWLPHHPDSTSRAAFVLIPPLVLFVLTMVAGTRTPLLATPRGVAMAVIALVWLGWRSSRRSIASDDAKRALLRRRLTGTAIVAGAAALVTGALGYVASPSLTQSRLVLREELTPPFDPYNYESPLAGFREYTKKLHDTKLFAVEGLQQGDRLRLAALDEYTGSSWRSGSPAAETAKGAGTYSLVGRDTPVTDFKTSTQSREISVTVKSYSDIWMPSIGYAEQLDFTAGRVVDRKADLRYNPQTGTGLVASSLHEGDMYRVRGALQAVPLEGQLDQARVQPFALPSAAPAPPEMLQAMQSYVAGQTAPYLQLKAIEEALKTQGYLSHGTASDQAPSRAGHGLDRLQELFHGTYLIGDQEQYAAAMALMARELGIPSRVVVGFAPSQVTGGTTEITGRDVTAWVEVPFEGFGWVAFDPTPKQTDAPVNTNTKPQTKPRAQVRQPPQTDARPDELVTAADRPSAERRREESTVLPTWVIVLALSIGVPLLTIGLILLAVALIRWWRSRRRHSGVPHAQVIGAWDETIDRYREFGYAVPERETRRIVAGALHPALAPVAVLADRATFAGEEPSQAEIEAAWADARAAVKQAGQDAGFWRRLRAAFHVRFPGAERRAQRAASLTRRRRMTADRARIRNEAIRSRGAHVPTQAEVARVERADEIPTGGGIAVSPDGTPRAETRTSGEAPTSGARPATGASATPGERGTEEETA